MIVTKGDDVAAAAAYLEAKSDFGERGVLGGVGGCDGGDGGVRCWKGLEVSDRFSRIFPETNEKRKNQKVVLEGF